MAKCLTGKSIVINTITVTGDFSVDFNEMLQEDVFLCEPPVTII